MSIGDIIFRVRSGSDAPMIKYRSLSQSSIVVFLEPSYHDDIDRRLEQERWCGGVRALRGEVPCNS